MLLNNLYLQRDISLQIVQTRVPSKIQELQTIALHFAEIHQYDKAILYEDEASSLKETNKAIEIEKIQKIFENNRKKLFNTFQKEIKLLENRYLTKEKAIAQQIEEDKIHQKKALEVEIKSTLNNCILKAHRHVLEITGETHKVEISNKFKKVCSQECSKNNFSF